MDTFSDNLLSLRGIRENSCDHSKYNLRYDWFYGPNNLALPFQETEWEPLEATNWEEKLFKIVVDKLEF